jgi:hypothetical protein
MKPTSARPRTVGELSQRGGYGGFGLWHVTDCRMMSDIRLLMRPKRTCQTFRPTSVGDPKATQTRHQLATFSATPTSLGAPERFSNLVQHVISCNAYIFK